VTFIKQADELAFGDVLADGRMIKEVTPGLTENWLRVRLMDGAVETFEGHTQIELKVTREQVRLDAGALIQHMQDVSDEADGRQPHTIVVRDPETGKYDTHGPYQDRLTARLGMLLLRERHLRDDPEFANLEYNIATHYGMGD